MTNNIENEDFAARFKKMSDQELIDVFNRQVGNSGWVGSRAKFMSALPEEFKNRGFDCSAVGNGKGLSFMQKVRLDGKKVIIVVDGPEQVL
ncbi:MAG: hypothetical protein AAB668_03090 [Patescibacteria group bacterium]